MASACVLLSEDNHYKGCMYIYIAMVFTSHHSVCSVYLLIYFHNQGSHLLTMFCNNLQGDLLKICGRIRLLILLILFLSILQPCLADEIIKNLTLADNGNFLVKHSHCGDHRKWLPLCWFFGWNHLLWLIRRGIYQIPVLYVCLQWARSGWKVSLYILNI